MHATIHPQPPKSYNKPIGTAPLPEHRPFQNRNYKTLQQTHTYPTRLAMQQPQYLYHTNTTPHPSGTVISGTTREEEGRGGEEEAPKKSWNCFGEINFCLDSSFLSCSDGDDSSTVINWSVRFNLASFCVLLPRFLHGLFFRDKWTRKTRDFHGQK
eukprot:Lithocolla_globosa_v1_NODE_2687_length_1903_cov_62.346861.p1 type:complete len:156 gc:universal NODE_2687_length_1903_cov_62.346861:1208-1675(+)